MPLDLDAIVHVTATCLACGWQASMRGPAAEVATFLRARAVEHLNDVHPASVPPDAEDLPVRDLGIV